MNVTYSRYDRYERRMRSLARILWWLMKHYLKIAIPLGLAVATLTFLGTVPGMITEPAVCVDFVYGEAPSCSAEALLSDVTFEYAEQGEDAVWSTEPPTAAGTYRVRAVSKNGFGKPRYSEESLFTIDPAALQLKVEDMSCTYGDVSAYTAENIDVQGLIGEDRIGEVSFAWTDVSIGEMSVSVESFTIVNAAGEDVTSSYTPNLLSGALVFERRVIELASQDEQKVYDGIPLTVSNCGISGGSLATGDRIEYIPDEAAAITGIGTAEARFTAVILDADGRDVSENYAIEYNYGTLSVTPRHVTLATRNDTKKYDGTPLAATECVVTEGSLAKGDSLIYAGDAAATVTVPGTAEASFTATVINEAGVDVTDQYVIWLSYGVLTVEPRPVTLTTASAEKVYDGKPLDSERYEITEGTFAEGHAPALTFDAPMTDVGERDNTATVRVFSTAGEDVTPYYELTVLPGILQITPRPLTLSSASAEAVYTGKPLIANEHHIAEGTLADGHQLSVTFAGTQTNVGESMNSFSAAVFDADRVNVTANYRLNYQYGTLTVTPILLTVSSESAQKVYDGTVLTKNVWKLTSGTLAAGQKLSVEVTGKQTDAGESDNTMLATVRDAAGKDVTALGYRITYEYGKLTVTRRPITVTSGSKSKPYDGKPLTYPSSTVQKQTQLVLDHRTDTNFTGMQTIVGSSRNTFSVRIVTASGENKTANYEVTLKYGTLTVTKAVQDDMNDLELDDSSNLSIADPAGGDMAFRIRSGRTGTIYTRAQSFGDYNGKGWNKSPTYSVTSGGINPQFYAGETLEANGKATWTKVDIQVASAASAILTPYQTRQTYAKPADVTDVSAQYSSASYSMNVSIGHSYLDYEKLSTPSNIRSVENSYRNFVDRNYLAIPSDTRAVLQKLANENGLRADSATLVTDIQKYIQNAANYNMGAKAYPANVDHVVYFLTVAREGICQQFASAATLMYRLFGIPARYTVGYVCEIKQANTWTDIDSECAHAWVEIYLDGVGWIPMEVTGGAFADMAPENHPSSSGESDEILIGRDPSMDDEVFARVRPVSSGDLYLRALSYGDYTGRGWKYAKAYGTSGIYPLSYVGDALYAKDSSDRESVLVRLVRSDCPYLLPSYTMGTGFAKYNDIQVTMTGRNYSVYAITGKTYADVKGLQTTAKNRYTEITYRAYVGKNYVSIPEETKSAMLEIAAQNGISANSPTVIEDVQKYIRGAAKYNLEVGSYPAGVDTAVYFLTQAKEGYCQHFATAATMMYRALGIPARYTVGYMVEAEANVLNDVLGKNAHAWVEVYRTGLGWVQVEVTPGFGEGVPTEVDGQEVLVLHNGKISVTVTAASVEKIYDGRPIDSALSQLTYVTEGDLLKGHYMVTTVSGAYSGIINAGSSQTNEIKTVKVYDSAGRDVTERYSITTVSGTLTILKRPITIRTGSASKRYDGNTLTESSWWITSGSIVPGHELEVSVSGHIKNVGKATNSFTCSITDTAKGTSMLSNYAITKETGTLTITK